MKINIIIAGVTSLFIGFLTIFLESYRNIKYVDFAAILFIGAGWLIIYGKLIDDKTKQSKTLNFISNIFLIGLITLTIYFAYEASYYRIEKILNDGPSKKIIAEVTGYETHEGRSSTTYTAIFQYKIGKDTVVHLVPESSSLEYTVSQKYEILYATDYPEMFRILKKVP